MTILTPFQLFSPFSTAILFNKKVYLDVRSSVSRFVYGGDTRSQWTTGQITSIRFGYSHFGNFKIEGVFNDQALILVQCSRLRLRFLRVRRRKKKLGFL